jgi:uncharacterized membrane protein
MKRVYCIDWTRGFVMIIMALDHVRDLLHVNSVTQSPTNLATTTPILFFTRWITYLCAPIFVFLAGSSAFLSFRHQGDIAQSRKFLLSRGIWLVVLEFTVVNLGLFFDPGFHSLLFEVIAAIGCGFIILSLILGLSSGLLGIIGLVIIFCHNLLPLVPFGSASIVKMILSPLFTLDPIPLFSNRILVIGYPPIPWLGIMLTGFASGKLFLLEENKRKAIFLKIGFGSLLLFILLRGINIYGDPAPWSSQQTNIYTFLSFMNITKYPPSLQFCLVTLGIMFIVLAFAEKNQSKQTGFAVTYGRVPLFYFIVHFYLIHFLLILILFLQGFHLADLNFATGTFGRPKDRPSGLPLWAIYLIWICLVAALYKPCVWFGRFKATHRFWWLRYV